MEAHGLKPHLPKPRDVRGYGEALTHGSVAQMFAVVAGVVLTVLGIVSLVVNASFSTGSSLTAEHLVFFDVNGWSGVLYLVAGLVMLMSATDAARTRTVAVVSGGMFLALTVWSLFDGSILGLLPVNDPTAILYAALGVIGLTAGLGPDRVRGGGD